MLKRIKIRGKLLLLLIAPLMAVVLFAGLGVLERTDNRDASATEVQIAELAEATADLSTALQVERLQTLLAGRLEAAFSAEIRPEETATDDALSRWRTEAGDIAEALAGTVVLESIQAVEADLVDVVSAARGERFTTERLVDELSQNAGRLNNIIVELQRQSTSIDLYQALDGAASLIGVQESLTNIAVIGDRSIANGTASGGVAIRIRDAITALSLAYDQSIGVLDAEQSSALDQLVSDGMLPRLSGSQSDNVSGFDALGEITVASQRGALAGGADWTTISQERLTAVNGVVTTIIGDAAGAATVAAADSEAEARQFLVLAVSIVVVALATAIAISRSISRPLIQLTKRAHRLSSDELPAMVESMRTAGRTPTPSMTPMRVKGRDEVAQLGRAFADMQNVTIEVAEEQGRLLRRGISDIFVNLARRNQSLLDRQIDFIDELESCEESPEQLENLFRLDHLATRMRRNAESLLVLAGDGPNRRRGRPVELVDVVRVAMGEIEDFARIRQVSIDSATVAGSVAVDLAHLLSELLENATAFSPPESDVEVIGHQSGGGSYQLTLSDRGIGMSTDQIVAANRTLSEPPIIGLDLSRSLGFTVVAQLAHRLGITVRLTSAASGGVTAVVTIPSTLVTPSACGEREGSESRQAQHPHHTRRDERAADAAPSAPTHRPGASQLPSRKGPARPTPRVTAPVPAAEVGVVGEQVTNAGLIRRTPKQVSVPSVARPPSAAAGAVPEQPTMAPGSRSPEEVREMLSRYRAGLRKGRGPEPIPTPSDGQS